MAYVITAVLVVLAVFFVRSETRPTSRPSRVLTWRSGPDAQSVAAGDPCSCGGTIGKSGKISPRFGDLLGCSDCTRSWTMDGRRILRRRASVPVDRSPD